MQLVSSRATFFLKRVLPIVIFVAVAGGVVAVVLAMRARPQSMPVLFPALLGPVVLASVAYLVLRGLVFNLMDEVWDTGDALIVHNKGDQARIPLVDIINIDCTILVNPPRITLTLRKPCKFGKEIAFSPPRRFTGFRRHPLADELIARVDAARVKNA